ncbi:hypothetical protein ACQ7HM_01855 [Williamsia sp. MIQD14]|uniref:hypothetical protein n=1 Tax=Williamsia sp. MIQD14 TaxID=3425703 RepID=UPI003DA0E113
MASIATGRGASMDCAKWTDLVERTVRDIDARILRGELPHHVLTFDDAAKCAAAPFTCIDSLSGEDRQRVVAGVDEVLRIRAGGVW